MDEVTAAVAEPEPPEHEKLPPHERPWAKPWQGPFLRSLSLIPDVSAARRVAGIGRTTAYRYRDSDPGFREAWDEALELARDLIQRTAHTWITTGVPVKAKRTRTVTKTAADGTVVETTTETVETESAERSSTLMIFWLKAHYPDRYRWTERVETTGANGGPVRIESVDAIESQIAELTATLEASARAAGSPPVPDEATRQIAE